MFDPSVFFSRILQGFLSVALVVLAIILIAFMCKETVELVNVLFIDTTTKVSAYLLIEGVIIYFLYFEFIVLIAKYFQAHRHFPLRYFIYIAVTAVLRLIIADHDNPTATLIYSFAILVLVAALCLASVDRLKEE